MNKTLILLILLLNFIALPSTAWSESIMKPFNDKGYGTISGRIQSLSMYRDYADNGLSNGANSTLGIILGYTSPEFAGFDAGFAYNYAEELFDNNNSGLLSNDDIHLFNEGWLRYSFTAPNLSGTTALIGRKISNGEVFRADDYRQKARSIEAVQIESTSFAGFRLLVGHALRMSNWLQSGDQWEFNKFDDVFSDATSPVDDDTDGITWGEAVSTRIEGLEIALFNAYAWDVANLIGARAKWELAEGSALLGYYRHENDVGKATNRISDAFGLSFQQAFGPTTLEPGFLSVHGNDLRFQETTTGINHALGASMMIYAKQYNGGADTIYLKATSRIGKTTLYGLYNYTWQSKARFDGQELNLVVNQQIIDNFSAAVKGGIGHLDMKGGDDTTATDIRLFLTYIF